MRFIHTADWHIDRSFFNAGLIDDQKQVFNQLINVIKDRRPDFVLVAGDVYDVSSPQNRAVCLLDQIMTRIVRDLETPVVIIAGNHDSASRVGYASRILKYQQLHVRGEFEPDAEPIVFSNSTEEVSVYALPYVTPSVFRDIVCQRNIDLLNLGNIRDHGSVMRESVRLVKENYPIRGRSILVGHAFVAGGTDCPDVERPLVGGASHVDAGVFDGFDYVALGHLHRSQQVSCQNGGCIRYSGSPMKYSFAEADHTKGILMVEMDKQGRCEVEEIRLDAPRDVRRIRGTFARLLCEPKSEDYLHVTLEDQDYIFDPVGQLREVYPNVLQLDFAKSNGIIFELPDNSAKIFQETPDVIFKNFYEFVTNAEPDEAELKVFHAAVEQALENED